MVPWTHWREPRLGRLSTDLTSEFTFFNLVIRLSKVKQSAFFRVSPAVSLLVELLAAVPGFNFFSIVAAASRETSFFSSFAQETVRGHCIT